MENNTGALDWQFSDLADVASSLGTMTTIFALVVGVATLLSSARTARLQQIDGLIKEYLRLQFEYAVAIGEGNTNGEDLRSILGAFKMYSLEEMVLWLRREKTWKLLYFWSRFHRRHIASWQAAIHWQLDQCSDRDLQDFEATIECYGPDLVAAVRESRRRVARRAAKAAAEAAKAEAEVG